MSENPNIVDGKIKGIADYLKSSVIEPAEKQKDDIIKDEMEVFDHQPPEANRKSGFFGSPEKNSKNGVQDDVMFAIGGAIYAGRELSIPDFRERKGKIDFGSFFHDKGLLGDYGQ